MVGCSSSPTHTILGAWAFGLSHTCGIGVQPMLPLRDTIPSRTVPIVNYALIGINTLLFFAELMMGQGLESFIQTYGFVPGRFIAAFTGIFQVGPMTFITECGTILSSMFLHGGWMHFGGNMLFLYIFGDNVEDNLGHIRYLIFYLTTGVIAALSQGILSPSSLIPTIGASGAISGVMGAYLRWFPHSRVLTLVPFFYFLELAEIPAFIYLILWFILQFFQGTLSFFAGTAAKGGVAWFAHIGGFLAGLAIAHRTTVRSSRKSRRLSDEDDLWPFDL